MEQITLSCSDITETALVSNKSVLYMLSKYNNTIEDTWAIKVMQYCNGSLSFEDLEDSEKNILLEKLIYYNINPDIEENIECLFNYKENESNICITTLYGDIFDNQFKPIDAKIASYRDVLWEDIIIGQSFRSSIITDGKYYIIDDDVILIDEVKDYCPNGQFIISKDDIDNSIKVGDYYICCNTENKYKEYSIRTLEYAETLYEHMINLSKNKLDELDEYEINKIYFTMAMRHIKYSDGVLSVELDYKDIRCIPIDEIVAHEYIILIPEILQHLLYYI